MQWNGRQSAGPTTGEPWLKVNPNYTEINVESALEDEESVFHYYQQLIELRDQYPILVYGKYQLILDDDQEIYAYTRTLEDEQLLVILNFFDGEPKFDLPSEIEFEEKGLLISNYDVDEAESIEHFQLRPYEARVYKLK